MIKENAGQCDERLCCAASSFCLHPSDPYNEELELNVQGPSTLNFGASQKPVSMKAGMAKKQGV